MWRIALRDLQWRHRRFLIALLATGLVFAVTLLTNGALRGIQNEAGHILGVIDADGWLVAEGTSGPFTAARVIHATRAEEVRELPGVREADPIVILHTTVLGREVQDINLLGYRVGGIGEPRVERGRLPRVDGEAVADAKLGVDIGGTLDLSGHKVTVVGIAHRVSFYYGLPTVLTPIGDTQQLAFFGQPLAMSIATRGVPSTAPSGLELVSPDEVRDDLERPLANGNRTIQFVSFLLWIVATGIIGSIVYLSALERTRDFAVLKAVGASSRSLYAGLALQAVALSVGAAILAMGLARLLTPGFDFDVDLAASAALQLVVIALVVGLLASVIGLRRAVATDPALAFTGN